MCMSNKFHTLFHFIISVQTSLQLVFIIILTSRVSILTSRISAICYRLVIVLEWYMLQNVVGYIFHNMPLYREVSKPLVLFPIVHSLVKINLTDHFSQNKFLVGIHLEKNLYIDTFNSSNKENSYQSRIGVVYLRTYRD